MWLNTVCDTHSVSKLLSDVDECLNTCSSSVTLVCICMYIPRPFPLREGGDHISEVVTIPRGICYFLNLGLYRVQTRAPRALQLPSWHFTTEPRGPLVALLTSLNVSVQVIKISPPDGWLYIHSKCAVQVIFRRQSKQDGIWSFFFVLSKVRFWVEIMCRWAMIDARDVGLEEVGECT